MGGTHLAPKVEHAFRVTAVHSLEEFAVEPETRDLPSALRRNLRVRPIVERLVLRLEEPEMDLVDLRARRIYVRPEEHSLRKPLQQPEESPRLSPDLADTA